MQNGFGHSIPKGKAIARLAISGWKVFNAWTSDYPKAKKYKEGKHGLSPQKRQSKVQPTNCYIREQQRVHSYKLLLDAMHQTTAQPTKDNSGESKQGHLPPAQHKHATDAHRLEKKFKTVERENAQVAIQKQRQMELIHMQ